MEENQSVFELQVDQTASKNLIDAAKWARFIAIFVFIAMGLFLLLMIAMQNRIAEAFSNLIPGMTSSSGFAALLIVCIVIVGVVSLIFSFLLRAANLIRKGIETKDQQMLINGLSLLKTYFAIYGVLAIIGVLFSLIGLIKN